LYPIDVKKSTKIKGIVLLQRETKCDKKREMYRKQEDLMLYFFFSAWYNVP